MSITYINCNLSASVTTIVSLAIVSSAEVLGSINSPEASGSEQYIKIGLYGHPSREVTCFIKC